ncbi:hypothetical protein LXL04_008314 [Taraxacum kok-saghyz]
MAAYLALKRGTTAATLFNKLLTPIRSASATPCVRRCFNTNASQVSTYDDFNRTVDVDRRPDSSVSRRRDGDFFSGDFRALTTDYPFEIRNRLNPISSQICSIQFLQQGA